jgi:aryl carrier-like protein
MVPSHFVLVPEFPLTPNGKVDLQRLPSPEEGVLTPRQFVAPRCPEEQWVSQVWQEILMQPQIGVESNFFELGGDSLSATRVFARINKLFRMDLSLRDLFENPTIAAVAGIIRDRRGRPAREPEQIPRLPRL